MSGVYAVSTDAPNGDVHQLSAEELSAFRARQYSVEDVLSVASLLMSVPKFPMDMLNEVLLFADFLISFDTITREEKRGHSNMDEVYLELSIPKTSAIPLAHGVSIMPQCRSLVVECSSHDQGWASEGNELNGTYDGSHTWSEIAVVKPHESEPEIDDEQHGGSVVADMPRTRVTTNVRAHRPFRRHLKEFKNPSAVVQDIELGDTVQLILRSQYPAWANTANYGRLCARFALDICEDAQLPPPTCEPLEVSVPTHEGQGLITGLITTVTKLFT